MRRSRRRAEIPSQGSRPKRLAFLDRDGTIIVERGFLSDPRGVRLINGAEKAIRELKRAGWAVVIVTNQSGVARGFYTLSQMRAVNHRVLELLARKGAKVDLVEFCPHHPEAKVRAFRRRCSCRKPGPGMALRASRRLQIPLRNCVVVGDRLADVQMAESVGGKGILVLTGYGRRALKIARKEGVKPVAVKKDLRAAARWILRRPKLKTRKS